MSGVRATGLARGAEWPAPSRRCDVLIVGGGPGGLIAARELMALDHGFTVMLLERDRAIGAPVRCGEGVGSGGLSEFIDPADAPWVSRRITKVIFWAPDGTEVRVAEGDVGYVLDRTRFEPALASQAGGAGAEILIGTEATGLRRDGDGWLVAVRGASREYVVRARLIIAADGVDGLVARWAGLDTRVPARDMESCAQYLVTNVNVDQDAIYLHFGDNVAPGGYAWVFPKGNDSANIGLGVVALHAGGRNARQWLDEYTQSYFPTGIRVSYTVGGVIVHPTIKRTVTDGLITVGDAAHMINPLSGGGIVNAMKAGRLAAAVGAEALAAGDTSAARLQRYHEEWMRMLGDDHIRFHRLKDALSKFDDAFFDDLARTVNNIAYEKRTLRRIFGSALLRHPTLLPVVAKYFV
ncbi:MAG: NAD(P)/FAD-dependent oxidoreductase [Gemmatimonadota bacterium]